VKRKPLSFATASLPKETAILNERILTPGNLDACEDPLTLFSQWFEEARAHEVNDPEAMSLATVDDDGLPDVRVVLCKDAEPEGLVFYTNAESAKGRQIERHPKAAALFHWKSLRRQARFRGEVRMLDEAAADAYFHSRHPQSQLGAWASQQSRPLGSRAELEARAAEFEARFAGADVPRPDYWGGYRLEASEVELWADGEFRLHDRVRFTRAGEGWTRQRLYP
jgi:pyridoxamine 5'-phosphate oxidase